MIIKLIIVFRKEYIMNRRQKLIIAILSVILIWLLFVIGSFFIGGPDLAAENKTILVLAADKYEQPNGGCDMAFIVIWHLLFV